MKIYYHPASTTSRPLMLFAAQSGISRWLGAMKALGSWNKVNEVINGFAASLKEAQLQPI